MSHGKEAVRGVTDEARRSDRSVPGNSQQRKGRWPAIRQMTVVLELLRGDALETLSRNSAVMAVTLLAWRDAFLAGGEACLKVRHENLGDGNGWRIKSVIADLTVDNERFRNRIRQLENARPSLRWRSCVYIQAQWPSTDRKEGRARVLAVWGRSRSKFYAQ